MSWWLKKNKWQGTRRVSDPFDWIRGGQLTGSTGMCNDHDPFREQAEEATGKLILVQPDNKDWLLLNKAVRQGDIEWACSIRNRMMIEGTLTVTDRFSPT